MAWIQAFEWGYFRAFIDFLRWDTWYGKSHKGHSLKGHNSWKLAQIGLKVPPFDSPCPCASDKPIQMPLAICFEILGLMVWFTNNPNSHGGDYYNSKNTPHDKVLEVSWIGFFFLHQREKNRSHPLKEESWQFCGKYSLIFPAKKFPDGLECVECLECIECLECFFDPYCTFSTFSWCYS